MNSVQKRLLEFCYFGMRTKRSQFFKFIFINLFFYFALWVENNGICKRQTDMLACYRAVSQTVYKSFLLKSL